LEPSEQHRLALAMRDWSALPDNEMLPSPCVSVCTMSPDQGWCLGCYRTLEEIATWASLKPQQQREVWRRVEERLQG